MPYLIGMLFLCLSALGQTRLNGSTQFAKPDFSGIPYSRPWPVGANLPTACRVGEVYFQDNSQTGRKFFLCTNANNWAEIGSGQAGSGSAVQSAELLDFAIQTASSSELRVGDACSIAKPCRVLIGTKTVSMTSNSRIFISGQSSTGILYIWLDSNGLRAGHNSSATITCTGPCAVETGISAFPPSVFPIAQIPFSSNVFPAVTPAMDQRAFLGTALFRSGESGNIRLLHDSLTGSTQVDLGPELDFGGMTVTKVTKRGTLAQRPSTCSPGELYYQTDSNAGLYHCPVSNEWTSLSGIGAIEVQADGAVVGSRAKLNLSPGTGTSLICVDDGANSRVSCTYALDSAALNSSFARLDANNIYLAGASHDFSASSLKLPASPSATPQSSGTIAYDTNTDQLRIGRNNATEVVALRNLSAQSMIVTLPNEGTTGTQLNLLAKINASGQALRAALSDTAGAVGVVVAGNGTSGSAQIAVLGVVSCTADNNSTLGNFVVIGSTTAGRCADGGSIYPISGQVIGRWLSTTTAGNSGTVLLLGLGQQNAASRSYLTIGANLASVTASSAQYISPTAGTFDSSHGNRAFAMPSVASAVRIAYRTQTAQPASGALQCTVRINDVASGLGFTVAANQAAGSATASGTAQWNAGDSLTIHCINSATAGSAAFTSISLEVQQ